MAMSDTKVRNVHAFIFHISNSVAPQFLFDFLSNELSTVCEIKFRHINDARAVIEVTISCLPDLISDTISNIIKNGSFGRKWKDKFVEGPVPILKIVDE
jgi:hypothetical protein